MITVHRVCRTTKDTTSNMPSLRIAPSILAGDFGRFAAEAERAGDDQPGPTSARLVGVYARQALDQVVLRPRLGGPLLDLDLLQ